MCEPSLSLREPRAAVRVTARVAGTVAALLLSACSPPGLAPTAPASFAGGQGTAGPVATATSPTPTPTVAPLPDPKVLAARLNKVSRAGIGRSGTVVLAADGTVLNRRGDRPFAPASTMKLLTALTAVDILGADHRFTTRVVATGKGRVVLVGGGDPLLTDKRSKAASRPASLQVLAARTAAALSASGVEKVSLGYAADLFTGPDFSPAWKPRWRSYLARVSPLVVDGGVYNQWQSHQNPARTAAEAFAKRLRAAGIKVTAVRPAGSPTTGTELAAVESAPLAAVVARTLKLSDNLAAEVLARHAALAAGRKASFTGASATIKAWLVDHGLWADGMRIIDGSGLAGSGRITPGVLAGAVHLALGSERLLPVADGLPVAGRSGTLKDRFDDKSERVARGNVHAKTGTLAGISSLAGYLTTADGARLVFAAMANDASGQTTAYNWLDRSVATLVRCGCR